MATTTVIAIPEGASPPAVPLVVTTTGFTATGSTPWQQFANTQVCAQVDGTATSVVAIVERTTQDPTVNASPTAAPVDSTSLTGNLATGIAPQFYVEPGIGWWRIRFTTLSGGGAAANASLSGTGR